MNRIQTRAVATLEALRALGHSKDPEVAHSAADAHLLDLIEDLLSTEGLAQHATQIREAYNSVPRRYA